MSPPYKQTIYHRNAAYEVHKAEERDESIRTLPKQTIVLMIHIEIDMNHYTSYLIDVHQRLRRPAQKTKRIVI